MALMRSASMERGRSGKAESIHADHSAPARGGPPVIIARCRCPSRVPLPAACFALIFLICAGLLAYALYLQHWKGLDPCPWCVVQRLGFMLVGLIALVGAIHGRGAAAYATFGFVAAVAGAAAGAYHV